MPVLDPPDLSKVIRDRIFISKERDFQALPCIITDYDNEKQLVRVKPVMYHQYPDGTNKAMAEIGNVPLMFPSSGGGSLTFPVKKGDECLVVFSDRMFDTWWVSGKVPSAPTVNRVKDYNDAIAIVGLKSKKNSLKAHTENVELRFDDDSGDMLCKLSMTPDGDVVLENTHSAKITLKGDKIRVENSEEELMDILSTLIDTLANNTVNTVYGTSPMNSKPALEALKSRLDKLKDA